MAYVKRPCKRVFGRPDNLEAFADSVMALDAAGDDVYLTINTIDGPVVRSRGLRARGREQQVVAVVALVADLDASPKPGHNYPTQQEIYQALLAMPLYPSLIVVSGRRNGGLHAYWLLDKPYLICDDADRHRVKNLSRRWQELLRSKLDGRELDSTYDLVRVLRPIGSTNQKYGTVVLETHDLDSAMKLQVEASLGASLDDVPYDRDSIDAIESALPPLSTAMNAPPAVVAEEGAAQAVLRAARWLSSRAPAIAASHGGGGGDSHTYDTAVCLIHGFGLAVDDAAPLMRQWNKLCLPPWSHGALERKLRCADAWDGDRPRGWLCGLAMSQNGERSGDLITDNCDIPTKLAYCPTPKTFKMQALDTLEPSWVAIPCGNRRDCEVCRSNWIVRNYRTIYRALADLQVQLQSELDGQNREPLPSYVGEVDEAGLRAACKYLERGKKRRGACPHYLAILRPGGMRLLISFAPYGPGCRPVAEPSLVRQRIYQALEAVPLEGKRGVTHSRGWLIKQRRSRRYALVHQ